MDIKEKGACNLGDEAYGGSVNRGVTPLAMVYSPEQYWGQLFEPEESLERGTLFEGLYMPWDPTCEEERR